MKTHTIDRIKSADNFFSRLIGLMGRSHWPERYDVFLFRDCRYLHTWFTFLKPDLIFTKKNGKIVSVFEKAGSWRFFGSFSAKHSLEAKSGFVRRRGIKVGDRLSFKL
jgi:uncharacterized membrane protein (UPF0127 family)